MEKIKCAAIKCGENIALGKRHADCFKEIFEKKWDKLGEIQGFITEEGRFVNRREARQIAEKAGQLIDRASAGDILYSEDIY